MRTTKRTYDLTIGTWTGRRSRTIIATATLSSSCRSHTTPLAKHHTARKAYESSRRCNARTRIKFYLLDVLYDSLRRARRFTGNERASKRGHCGRNAGSKEIGRTRREKDDGGGAVANVIALPRSFPRVRGNQENNEWLGCSAPLFSREARNAGEKRSERRRKRRRKKSSSSGRRVVVTVAEDETRNRVSAAAVRLVVPDFTRGRDENLASE